MTYHLDLKYQIDTSTQCFSKGVPKPIFGSRVNTYESQTPVLQEFMDRQFVYFFVLRVTLYQK